MMTSKPVFPEFSVDYHCYCHHRLLRWILQWLLLVYVDASNDDDIAVAGAVVVVSDLRHIADTAVYSFSQKIDSY